MLEPLAAHYFLKARTPKGRLIDSVARFHLGNGARLERINWLGDLSPKGVRESAGIMVNYLYRLDDIEKNHEAYANEGEVVASSAVKKLLKGEGGGCWICGCRSSCCRLREGGTAFQKRRLMTRSCATAPYLSLGLWTRLRRTH